MSRDIEPGLLRAFRYFTGIALGYFSILILYTVIQTGRGFASVQIQWYLNFASNLALFIYLSLPGLHHRLKSLYLPLALSIAAVVPVLSNLVFLAPQTKDVQTMVEMAWLLVPSMLVTVVLIAWQYSFPSVLAFTVSAAFVELSLVYPMVGRLDAQTFPLLGLPLVRAFAFGIVGHIVSRMVAIQRAQRRELIRANMRLSQHAATLEQLTLSRERNRLARELHDTLAHTLTGQAVNLEATKMMLAPDQVEVETMLDKALNATRAGLAEVRRALKDLRSQSVEDLGLSLAIRNVALEAAARADFVLNMDVAPTLPHLNAETEHAIYRITQEALANVVDHASAAQVTLSLGIENGKLSLVIADDGCGVNLDQVDFEGKHGLKGIQERAAMVGGKFEIVSHSEVGTSLRFSVEVGDD